jgi:hypothetical protein
MFDGQAAKTIFLHQGFDAESDIGLNITLDGLILRMVLALLERRLREKEKIAST